MIKFNQFGKSIKIEYCSRNETLYVVVSQLLAWLTPKLGRAPSTQECWSALSTLEATKAPRFPRFEESFLHVLKRVVRPLRAFEVRTATLEAPKGQISSQCPTDATSGR